MQSESGGLYSDCNQEKHTSSLAKGVRHICPEASKGGPIALIEDGDIIEIDIPNNSLNLQVDEATLSRRRENWMPHEGAVAHGYIRLYRKYVRPACEGEVLD